MRKLKTLTILLVALAFTAGAAFAASSTDAPETPAQSLAPESADLVQPMPIAQSSHKCGPHEEEVFGWFELINDPDDCEPLCTDFCQSEGGYLLSWSWNLRGASCYCRCCV